LAPLGLRDLKLNNGMDIVGDSRGAEMHVGLKLALKLNSSGLLLIKTSEGNTLHFDLLFFEIVFTGENRLNREADTSALFLDESAFNHTLHTTLVLSLLMRHTLNELLSLAKKLCLVTMLPLDLLLGGATGVDTFGTDPLALDLLVVFLLEGEGTNKVFLKFVVASTGSTELFFGFTVHVTAKTSQLSLGHTLADFDLDVLAVVDDTKTLVTDLEDKDVSFSGGFDVKGEGVPPLGTVLKSMSLLGSDFNFGTVNLNLVDLFRSAGDESERGDVTKNNMDLSLVLVFLSLTSNGELGVFVDVAGKDILFAFLHFLQGNSHIVEGTNVISVEDTYGLGTSVSEVGLHGFHERPLSVGEKALGKRNAFEVKMFVIRGDNGEVGHTSLVRFFREDEFAFDLLGIDLFRVVVSMKVSVKSNLEVLTKLVGSVLEDGMIFFRKLNFEVNLVKGKDIQAGTGASSGHFLLAFVDVFHALMHVPDISNHLLVLELPLLFFSLFHINLDGVLLLSGFTGFKFNDGTNDTMLFLLGLLFKLFNVEVLLTRGSGMDSVHDERDGIVLDIHDDFHETSLLAKGSSIKPVTFDNNRILFSLSDKHVFNSTDLGSFLGQLFAELAIDLVPVLFGLLDETFKALFEFLLASTSFGLATSFLFVFLFIGDHSELFRVLLLFNKLFVGKDLLLFLLFPSSFFFSDAVLDEVTETEDHLNFIDGLIFIALNTNGPLTSGEPFIVELLEESSEHVVLAGETVAHEVDSVIFIEGDTFSMESETEPFEEGTFETERLVLGLDGGLMLEHGLLRVTDQEGRSLESNSLCLVEEDLLEARTDGPSEGLGLVCVLNSNINGKSDVGLLSSSDTISHTLFSEWIDGENRVDRGVVDGRLDEARSSNTNKTFKSRFRLSKTGVEVLDGERDNDGVTVRQDDGKTVGTRSGVDVGTGHHDANETICLSLTFAKKLEDALGNLGACLTDPFLVNGKETLISEKRTIDNTTGFFANFVKVEFHVLFNLLKQLFNGFFAFEVAGTTADAVHDMFDNLFHALSLFEDSLVEVFESLDDETEVTNSGDVGSLVGGEASVDGTGNGRNIGLGHFKLSLKAKVDEMFILGKSIPLRVLASVSNIRDSTKNVSDATSGLLHTGDGGVNKGTESRVSERGNLLVFLLGKFENDATKSSFSRLGTNENRKSSNTEFILFFLVEIDALNNGLDGSAMVLSRMVKGVDGNLTNEVNVFRDVFTIVTFGHLFELIDNAAFTINVGDEDLEGSRVSETGKGLDVDGLLMELGGLVETFLDKFNILFSLPEVLSTLNFVLFSHLVNMNFLASASGGFRVSADEVTESNTGSGENETVSFVFLSCADISDKIENGLGGLDETGLKVFENTNGFESGKLLSLDLFNKEFSSFIGSSESSNINEDLTLNLLLFSVMVLSKPGPKLDEVLLVENTHTHGELNDLVSDTTLEFDVVRNDNSSERLDQGFNLLDDFLAFSLTEEGKILSIKMLLAVFFGETVDEGFVLLGFSLESLAPITLNLTFTGKTELNERDGGDLLLTKRKNLLVESLSLVHLDEFTLGSTTVFLGHVVVVCGERLNEVVVGVEVDRASLRLVPVSHLRFDVSFNDLRNVIGANIFASTRIVTAEDKATLITIVALHVVDGLGEVEVVTVIFVTVVKNIIDGLAMSIETMLVTSIDNGFFTTKLLFHVGGGSANSEKVNDGTVDIDNFFGHLLRSFKFLELVVTTKVDEHRTVLLDGPLRSMRNTNGTSVVLNLLVERTSIHMTKLKSKNTESFLLFNLDSEHSVLFKTCDLLVLTWEASGHERTVGEIVFLAVFEDFWHEVIVAPSSSTTVGSSQGNESRKNEEDPHFVYV